MIRKTLIGSAVALPVLVAAAFAQDALVTTQGPDELRGDWVIGATITSTTGETIGTIEDLIINMDDGTVAAAVVSVGGFLGFGAKDIAVDWSELQIDWDANDVVLDMTREQAEDAPEYTFRDREQEPAPEPADGGAIGGEGMNGGATTF